MSLFARAPVGRLACAGVAATLFMLMAACSGSSRAIGTPAVGTSAGVVLTTSQNTVQPQLQQGGTVTFTATVGVDPNSEGVTWVLSGVGTLSANTKTTVVYTAPATGVVGTTTPTITATAVHDATETSTATIFVLGTPVIVAPTLFPANVNSLYGANLVVSGGLAPFVWTQGTGTLPPGITLLTTSTSAVSSFSGTPTAAGTYTFQVKATDSNTPAIVATVDITVVVKPAAACLLEGQYALVTTGFDSNKMTVSAASLTVSSTGTISGYHDFNSPSNTANVAETLTGTCTTRVSNNGALTLTGAKNSPEYDYAVTTALTRGRVQLDNGGDTQSASGFFQKQDPTAFVQTALAGNFAFGTLGVADDGTRLGLVGALAIDAGGTVTGNADENGGSALTDAPLAGVLGAPDTNGRGTLTLTATASGGNQTFHFAYYIVNADRLLLVTTDAAPRLAGYMTRQSGAFANSSLANPAILSLWGAAKVAAPMTTMTLARLSGANATNGTLVLHIDVADQLTAAFDETTGAVNGTYAVRAADGRTTFGFGTGSAARHFVVYMDSAANGYVIEQGSAVANAGILEPQSAGPFTSSLPGFFVSGTQYPEDVAPMVLMPSVSIANGVINSANAGTGYFAIDTATGRAIGSTSLTGSGQALFVAYIVNPNRMVTFRTGALNRSAVMDWLDAN